MLFISVFLLGTMVQPCFFQCTDSQLGHILPADICDNKRCLSLSQDTFEILGKEDYKLYTWTKADRAMTGYCSYRENVTFTPSTYGTMSIVTVTFTTRSGKYCNITNTVSTNLTSERDPVSGNYSIFTSKEGNETWQICHTSQIYNGPFVRRTCRVDPPPEVGNGYGYITVWYQPKGNCQLDAINEFLDDYDDVYWKEISVNCSVPEPN